jgi:hypothetical protein
MTAAASFQQSAVSKRQWQLAMAVGRRQEVIGSKRQKAAPESRSSPIQDFSIDPLNLGGQEWR